MSFDGFSQFIPPIYLTWQKPLVHGNTPPSSDWASSWTWRPLLIHRRHEIFAQAERMLLDFSNWFFVVWYLILLSLYWIYHIFSQKKPRIRFKLNFAIISLINQNKVSVFIRLWLSACKVLPCPFLNLCLGSFICHLSCCVCLSI